METRPRVVELAHVIEDGMPAFPGLPAPRIGAHLDHAASRSRYGGRAEFFFGEVAMTGNTGTYVDSPFHRYAGGDDLAAVPLDRLVDLPGVVVDCSGAPGRSLEPELPRRDLSGHAVLVRTGWDARWGTEAYWEPGPYLSDAAVARLLGARAGLVGVDFWNVDDVEDPARPVHTRLLAEGVPIVEHVRNLGSLPADGFRFFAPVLAIRGGASFPVRAFALVP